MSEKDVQGWNLYLGPRGKLGTRQEQQREYLQNNQSICVCEALGLPPGRARARALCQRLLI